MGYIRSLRRLRPKLPRQTDKQKSQTPVILVVEDDLSILSAVAEVLEMEGYTVEMARNGAEGLTVLEKVRPSLILLDMRMPIMNGWEFAQAMQQRDLKVPTLVMTAAQDAKRWSQEIGADGYVSKPFHIEDLLSTVEQVLSQY